MSAAEPTKLRRSDEAGVDKSILHDMQPLLTVVNATGNDPAVKATHAHSCHDERKEMLTCLRQ